MTGAGEPCSWADLAEVSSAIPSSGSPRSSGAGTAAEQRLSVERARSLGVPLADWRDSVMRYLDGER